jgi:hypothetical protein
VRSVEDPKVAILPFMSADTGEPIAWESAQMLINPDSIRLEPPASPTEQLVKLTAKVVQSRYRGYNTELVCSLPDTFATGTGTSAIGTDAPPETKLQVLTPDHAREWTPGQQVDLYIEPSELLTLERTDPATDTVLPDAGHGSDAGHGHVPKAPRLFPVRKATPRYQAPPPETPARYGTA